MMHTLLRDVPEAMLALSRSLLRGSGVEQPAMAPANMQTAPIPSARALQIL
jgi:hypothetical protein